MVRMRYSLFWLLTFASFFSFQACSPTRISSKPVLETAENKSDIRTDSIQKNDPTVKIKMDTLISRLFDAHPEYFKSVVSNAALNNLQVIYTEIDRNANNEPHFQDHFFAPGGVHYYYPASTVKLPTAVLALQKLNELDVPGLDRNTTMVTESAYYGQTPTYNDPQSPEGRPSISTYIQRILLVSDNDAFNRLYEFLGQEYLNRELHKRGYDSAQIIHRLEISLSEDENRHTNPVTFYDDSGQIVYQQPMHFNKEPFSKRNDFLGEAYYRSGTLLHEPMNFSLKNRLLLKDLHCILKSIIFPDAVEENKRFHLTDEDYRFLYRYMSATPFESAFPAYDPENFWETYVKFLLYGSEKVAMPKHLRIFNKVGDAYGQLIDAAYIVDFDNKVEFMLSAAINCNTKQVLNDDTYDYETIGLPFMKHLGEVEYEYELERHRLNVPDLSRFKVDYDQTY